MIGAKPPEIIFTGGATESLALALKGVCYRPVSPTPTIVTCALEHEAVLETCRQLNRVIGTLVHVLPVDSAGRLDCMAFERVVNDSPGSMGAVMLVNNEIGTIQPVRQIGEIVHQSGGMLLSDITQAVGKIQVDVEELGIDLAAFSSHKIYGPKGVGAIFLRGGISKCEPEPLMAAGG